MKVKIFQFIPPLKNPVFLCLGISWCYWIYLLSASTMYIKYDPVTFERLGSILHHQGWAEFFKEEPDYVPVYPLLISFSMRVADLLLIPYLKIQTLLQILFLLATQLLLLMTLRTLRIRPWILAVIILYFGLSPAVINSGFSLYSEIACYPFVLGVILITRKLWEASRDTAGLELPRLVFSLIVLFVVLALTNAVFEYVLTIFLILYFFMSLPFLFQKEMKRFLKNTFIAGLILLSFHLLLTPYKKMNLRYNGHKTLVVKGAWSLYANTFRRTEPLTGKHFLTALAYIPGEGICEKLFGDSSCNYWAIETQHGLGMRKLNELRQEGVPNDQIDSILINLSKKRVLQKPFQFSLFTLMEGLKMFFWESTRVGYVFYPSWLEKIYNFTLFKNGIRSLVAIITLVAVLYAGGNAWKTRRCLYSTQENDFAAVSILFFSLCLFLAYSFMHSFFCIAVRYTFAMIPLYLICIAYTAEQLCSVKRIQ